MGRREDNAIKKAKKYEALKDALSEAVILQRECGDKEDINVVRDPKNKVFFAIGEGSISGPAFSFALNGGCEEVVDSWYIREMASGNFENFKKWVNEAKDPSAKKVKQYLQ